MLGGCGRVVFMVGLILSSMAAAMMIETAMAPWAHEIARFRAIEVILGRGTGKSMALVAMVASDGSGEVNSVMPVKCAAKLGANCNPKEGFRR